MKKLLIVPMLLLGTFFFMQCQLSSTTPSKKLPPETPSDSVAKGSEKDILPQILSLNSNEKCYPKKDFRKGVVTPSKIANYLTKTADGYCIQLPSSTNIPTPAVMDGTVYLSGGFGSRQYYAFEAETGKAKWAVNLDDDGPSSPALESGIVVFNTESCTIFACDMVTGKHIWSYFLGDPLMSMPTIANGIVFTSYPARYEGQVNDQRKLNDSAITIFPSHVLIAIELKTGKILWQKWIDSDVMSAPVAKDDLLYLTTFSGALYKVKQQNGQFIEAKALRATSAPVFSSLNELVVSRRSDTGQAQAVGESVVIGYGAKQKAVYKKDATYLDKKVQDKSRLKGVAVMADAGNGFTAGAPASANSSAAYENIGQSNVSSLQAFQGSRGLYKNGRLYNTMGDEIVCTDSTGAVKWKHQLDGDLKGEGGYMGTPPVYANGYIIVATLKGEVLVFDENKGTVSKKYQVKDAIRYQPVVDNGWIFVTTVNSKMYAINTANPAITGWNMWGANAARTNEFKAKP
ncbi:MAG: PQQ-binding-like beta-propeller repeat protein [Bacteroidota bacterium]